MGRTRRSQTGGTKTGGTKTGAKPASSALDRFVDWFLPADIAAADRDTRQRARMFLISHILGPFLGNTVPGALLLVDPSPGWPVAILAMSITGFWVFPFVLKAGARYNLLAFLSIQNLIFCILWSCYFYGGVSSPTLAWVLTIPLLAFFYLGSAPKLRFIVFGLIAANFAGFYGLHLLGHEPVNDTPRASLQVLGIISTVAAAGYVAMMATYYARILASGVELEAEMKRHLITASELRTATAEADRANVAKSEFVARMGHELRTPLNAVIGYSQMLLEDNDGDEAEAQDLNKIHTAGQYLLKLVDEVLDLSKIDAGKMQLLPAETPLAPYLGFVVEEYREKAEANRNTIEACIPEDLGSIVCDQDRVRQALGHLLDNAAKFTEDGKITVTAERRFDLEGERVAIRVEDTGIGISEENQAHLFEYFTAGADDASASKYGGTGLGLALACKLCRLMGGDIEAESTLGVGSAFTLILPTAPGAGADEDAQDLAWISMSVDEESHDIAPQQAAA
jgi:signal transduction histidine kinase